MAIIRIKRLPTDELLTQVGELMKFMSFFEVSERGLDKLNQDAVEFQ